ncbi:hypothetical protein RYX36_031051 [Vicia faba]
MNDDLIQLSFALACSRSSSIESLFRAIHLLSLLNITRFLHHLTDVILHSKPVSPSFASVANSPSPAYCNGSSPMISASSLRTFFINLSAAESTMISKTGIIEGWTKKNPQSDMLRSKRRSKSRKQEIAVDGFTEDGGDIDDEK